jgi:hypothetical protein
MDITYIYYLCKDDGVPLYIGKTKNSPNLRLNDHRYKKEKNLNINVIDEVPTSDWKFWEKHYISLFKSWGFKLNNINNGGGGPKGGYFLTQETKNKIGKANSKPKPKEFGEKISKQRKGNWKISEYQIQAGILAKNKSTLQFDKQGNFIKEHVSSKKAAEYIGVHEVNMRLHLGGKYKTCKGFIFKYKENGY